MYEPLEVVKCEKCDEIIARTERINHNKKQEETAVNQYELAKFFREELHINTDVDVTRYLTDLANYQNVRADIVLKNKKQIAIEHKESGSIAEIEKGIGQALLNLLIFQESWLSVPEKALELVIPILKMVNIESFRILDWENMQLHELKNSEVVATGL